MKLITIRLETPGVPVLSPTREKQLIKQLPKFLGSPPAKVAYEEGLIVIRSNTSPPPTKDQVERVCKILERLLEDWNGTCAGIGSYTIEEHPEVEEKRVLEAEQLRSTEEDREAELAELRKHGHVPNTWKKTAAGVSGWTDEELYNKGRRYGKVSPPANSKPAEQLQKVIQAVTWNTAGNNHGRNKTIIEADLCELLSKGDYDVILLQECPLGVSINNYICVAHSAPFAPNGLQTFTFVFIKKSPLEKAVPSTTYKPSWDSGMLTAYYNPRFLGCVGFLSMHMRSTADRATKKKNIARLMTELEGPLLIGGDFNFEPNELDAWDQLFSSRKPTHRMGTGKQDKIHDFFIVSLPLLRRYDICVDVLSIKAGSDHDPVTLSLKIKP